MIAWGALMFASAGAVLASTHDRRLRPLSYFLAVVLLIVVSAIRFKTGYDYDNYVQMYFDIVNDKELSGIGIGWQLLNVVSLELFDTPRVVFLLSSVLIYGVIAWVLFRATHRPEIALLTFVLGIGFYWESLSILRQYAAIAFSFLAGYFWTRSRTLPYLLAVLVATSFHFTAIIGLVIPLLTLILRQWVIGLVTFIAALILYYGLEPMVMELGVLAKYRVYFDGTIEAAGREQTGLVIYIKMAIALMMIILVSQLPGRNTRKANLAMNGVILGYGLFMAF